MYIIKIYVSNRIHTSLNYTHVHRTASKLHIYTSIQIHIHRNYTYINDTVQINRNAFVHIEIIRLYFVLVYYESTLDMKRQRIDRQACKDERTCPHSCLFVPT